MYFFGPSLMERVLIMTGGQCFPKSVNNSGKDLPGPIHGDFCRSKVPISPESHPHAFRTANKALSDAHFAGGVTGKCKFFLRSHLYRGSTSSKSI